MKSRSIVRLDIATLTANDTCSLNYWERQFAAHEQPRCCSSCRINQLPKSEQFQLQRKSKKADEGALHLISFDTSPLKGFVQMCTMFTFCAHRELPEIQQDSAFHRAHRAHNVHGCARDPGIYGTVRKLDDPTKKIEIHIVSAH